MLQWLPITLRTKSGHLAQFIICCMNWSLPFDLFYSILFFIHHAQNTLTFFLHIKLPDLIPISETTHFLFLLPTTPSSDFLIISDHSAFNSNVSIWGLLFQLCYLKAALPLLSVILTYLVGFRVPEIIFLIYLFMYSLPYLPWRRCKLLTGRNSSLRTTISSQLEGSLVHSRFSKNLSNWITNTTCLAFMVAAFSLLFFLLFYHLLCHQKLSFITQET